MNSAQPPPDTMTTYEYDHLPSGSIRLLKLLPSKNAQSPLRCQFITTPLADASVSHPYEALSYEWGVQDPRSHIGIVQDDGAKSFLSYWFGYRQTCRYQLEIWPNLRAALLHLRDRITTRVLWIDAVCIDQSNQAEKEHQIQSMARIYANASRVVAWLGEAAYASGQALEDIRTAAEQKSRGLSVDCFNYNAVILLLQRRWFQRMWILQEMAAAKEVLVKCGPAEIDGYLFCSGLNALNLTYEKRSDIRNKILPATYLMRESTTRSRDPSPQPGRFSLNIRPLSELVDMYHNRDATLRHDKVYALLGMSCDDPIGEGITVDYHMPWGELFQQLITYFLSKSVSVQTWDDKVIAVVKGKGYILGEISSIEKDPVWDDKLDVKITSRGETKHLGRENSFRWTIQTAAKPVYVGDIVCLLEGAQMPTIIRRCKDFSNIVRIGVFPSDDAGSNWLDFLRLRLKTASPRTFLLVWDWDAAAGESTREEKKTIVGSRVPCRRTHLMSDMSGPIRLWEMGLLLVDIGCDDKAERSFYEAMDICEKDLVSRKSAAPRASESDHWANVNDAKPMIELMIRDEGGFCPLEKASKMCYKEIEDILHGARAELLVR